MSRILISGYYGYKNIGDEAILKSIVAFLKRHTANPEMTVLTADVQGAKERFGIRGVDRNHVLKVIREVAGCDYLISGGGSLLQDVTSKRSIIYYFAILFFARIFKKKTIIYCQGIGPIRKKSNRIVTGWLLRKACHITVRDPQSKGELISLGIKADSIHVSSDPVLAFPMSEEGKTRRIMELLDGIRGHRLIGVSLKKPRSGKSLEAAAKDLNRLNKETDAIFVCLPFHEMEDREVYGDLENLLDFKPLVVTEKFEVEEMLALMASMDFFIGVRLHSLILASVADLPFIALTYDPKIDHFMQTMELDPPLSFETLEAGELYEAVVEALQEKNELGKRIRSGRLRNIQKLLENNETIGKIIDERE